MPSEVRRSVTATGTVEPPSPAVGMFTKFLGEVGVVQEAGEKERSCPSRDRHPQSEHAITASSIASAVLSDHAHDARTLEWRADAELYVGEGQWADPPRSFSIARTELESAELAESFSAADEQAVAAVRSDAGARVPTRSTILSHPVVRCI
jgi:hypothetical protein